MMVLSQFVKRCKMMLKYPIGIFPLGVDEYCAFYPDLPGCMSVGKTPEEALKNAQDAIDEWIDFCKVY